LLQVAKPPPIFRKATAIATPATEPIVLSNGSRGALLGFRRLGVPVFSARSLALDGVSWTQGGWVEVAVGL
jgi:hypothetical protein